MFFSILLSCYFQVSFNLKVIVGGQNNSKYRDWAPSENKTKRLKWLSPPLAQVASCTRLEETNEMAKIRTWNIVTGNDGWASLKFEYKSLAFVRTNFSLYPNKLKALKSILAAYFFVLSLKPIGGFLEDSGPHYWHEEVEHLSIS